MRDIDKRYQRQFWLAMVTYVIFILGSTALLNYVSTFWLRVGLAILPMLPVVAVVRAMLQRVLAVDELQRRIELEAVSISAMTVGLLSFSYGLIEAANVSPFGHESMMMAVLPGLFFTYGLARSWAVRRYR